MCHNSASSDQNNRVLMGVDASEAYDGKVGQTYEFKTMLHAIHFAGGTAALNPDPIVIYRTRGIYAWVGDGETLPNWPTGALNCPESAATKTGYLVFGADPASDVKCQPHTLYHPTYPRDARQCSGCHVAGFATIPDQSVAVATTIDAGVCEANCSIPPPFGPNGTTRLAPVWKGQLDDTLQGPAAAACTSCHSTTSTRGHAYNESWIPQTFPNGRQTILDQR
jgi:hypothetical protein